MTGQAIEVLSPVLDGLVRARLVADENSGADLIYEVAHPLVGETIVAAIGGARRRGLHRQVGRALLAAGRLGEAAPHFARAGDVGDPEAVDALTAALRQAEEREAFREALQLIACLGELLPVGDTRWIGVADALAWPAEWVVDHRADVYGVAAISALRAIDAVLEQQPGAASRAKVKFRLASFLNWSTGELKEGRRHCQSALELLEAEGDMRSVLLASNELAWSRGLGGDYDALEQGAAEVVARARRAGEQGVELQGLMAQGFGALWGGHLAKARSITEDGLGLARETDSAYRVPYALAMVAFIVALEGRVEESRPLLTEAKSLGLPYHEGLFGRIRELDPLAGR